MKLNMWKKKTKQKQTENPLEKARLDYQTFYRASNEAETQQRCAYYRDEVGCIATTNETYKHILQCRIEKEDELRKKNRQKIKKLSKHIDTIDAEIQHLEGLRSKPTEVKKQLKESKAEYNKIKEEIDDRLKGIHDAGEKIARYRKLKSSVCMRCKFFTPERLLVRTRTPD